MTDTRVLDDRAVAVTVNGTQRRLQPDSTLADLLASLGVDARMVVVEHNRVIIRDRERLAAQPLADGDVVEIVHFVGGG